MTHKLARMSAGVVGVSGSCWELLARATLTFPRRLCALVLVVCGLGLGAMPGIALADTPLSWSAPALIDHQPPFSNTYIWWIVLGRCW